MKKQSSATRRSYALALLVLFAGFIGSWRSGDWSWLARSGSLIVVIGLLLTSTQIIENSRRIRLRRHKRQANLRAQRDWASDSEQLRQSRDHDDHLFENERSGLYMLVAGTLIWGFGDLAGLVLG